jgi:hypothetical protein
MITRILGTLLGISLVAPVSTAYAAAPIEVDNVDRAKQLNLEGQRRFNEQDFEGAAAAWIRILEVLPENATNREERDNTLLITLEAYKEASRRFGGGEGPDAAKREIDVLRKALAVRDDYVGDFRRAYGNGATVSSALADSVREVEEMLAAAEKRAGTSTPKESPIIGMKPDTLGDQPFRAPRGPSGNGLIAGGAVLIALGLGSTSMIIIGAKRAKDARGDYRDAREAMDEDGMKDADRRGRRSNGLIAGGAVMTGVFLAGGATMLALGIRRRVRYQAFTPVMGPQYVGIGWSGRF